MFEEINSGNARSRAEGLLVNERRLPHLQGTCSFQGVLTSVCRLGVPLV